MIGNSFTGILKKFGNFRTVDDVVVVKLSIKHSNEGSVQTFLDSFVKKLAIDGIDNNFTFPVRWKKLVFDVSDFINKTYLVKFDEVEFKADLDEISITHKFANGNELFDYNLSFTKEPSKDNLDLVIAEAYLNYKEENDAGKKEFYDFPVTMELIEKTESQVDDDMF